MKTHPKFRDRRLLILGGTSGIGLAVAKRILEGGGSAVLVGRRAGKAAAAADRLAAIGDVAAFSHPLDDRSQLQALLQRLDGLGPFDLMVNAAGVFAPKPFLEHEPVDYDRYAELNRTAFFATQHVARGMAARKRGAIVNIGSM